ncbi:MAG: glycine betaine ABC transporter substrate-binding protein [Erysipelotrichaceae bacterium]
MKKIWILFVFSLILTACGSSEATKKVVIASKPHSEQYILADMLTLLIEAKTDIVVEQKLGIGGGTSNIHPAMVAKEIDIYPEYTGTGWLFVLKEEPLSNTTELYTQLKTKYAEEFGIAWLDTYGFNNTYAIAVREETATTYNITTISDLASASSNLVFGAEYDFFEREDGYNALVTAYGLNFADTKDMDIGLKYQAIGASEVDVINAFSTDGLIQEYNLKVLEDDLGYFPSYFAATLVRQEILDQYPELEAVCNLLSNQISDSEMVAMNYEVESNGREPMEVAKEFLVNKGLLDE